MILSQAFNQAALKNPGGPAIFDLGKSISFSDARKKISQLSYLYQAEVGHGKRIAFLSQNNQATILSFFAFSNIGCPSIFFDPNENNETIIQAIRDLEITHVCISSDQASRVSDIIRSSGLALSVLEIEKKKGGEYDTSFSPPPDHPLKETDMVLILRHEEIAQPTKYIFFTHKQIYGAAAAVRRFYHFSGNDRLMTTMSWSHPFSLLHGMLVPIFAGITCAVNPQCASHEEFIEYIAQNHINRFADNSKFFYWLLSICRTNKFLLPGVKSVTVGLGNLPTALRKTFNLLHVPVLQTYGRVEALWTIAMEDSDKAKDSPIPNMEMLPGYRYKVLNLEGDEIPGPGTREGPLAVTAEPIMNAFFHPDKPVAEKASKLTIRGTWFYTGDCARLEGENDELKIKFLGHSNDLVLSGHRYLCPDRIEELTKELSDVLDAAAFVTVNEDNESYFGLAVVRQGKLLSENQILENLRGKISEPEIPKNIHFLDTIPKDRYENVNRGALRRQFSPR